MSSKSEKPFPCALFDPSDKIPDFEIDDVTRKALCFREDLIISLKDEITSDKKPVGGYSVSLESIGTEGNEFMIQVLSSLTVNDTFAGSRVLSSATAKFHCLEEKRTEFIHRADGLHEKVLFIGLEDDLYHLETEDLCPCDKSSWQKDLPLCSSGELISEGASLLLMRYLALKNFHGNLSFQSIMIGGQLTTCNYRCSEAQLMKFNSHNVEVYTIERKMHEECGLVHNIKTHMTRGGHILRHDWLEVPYLLQINSLLDPNNIDGKEPRVIVPLRSRWSSDVQMMSMYLDKKTCKMAQQTEYLTDHPEIKQLISDYTQALLAGNLLANKAEFLPSFLRQLSRQEPSRLCSVCGICLDCPMSKQHLINSEGDRVDRSSRYSPPGSVSPRFSLCSVFSKCPSDATCVRRLSGDSKITVTCSEACKACKHGDKKYSHCSFYPECEKTCQGCRLLERKKLSACSLDQECKTSCDGCRSLERKRFSVCGFDTKCEEICDGCRSLERKRFSACGFDTKCEEICDGCRSFERKRFSACSFGPKCKEICDGCRPLERKYFSACSFDQKCEETCDGCRSLAEKKFSVCSLYPKCKKDCDGCQPHREPCRVNRACPECPGCRRVCSDVPVNNCGRSGAESIQKDLNLANNE